MDKVTAGVFPVFQNQFKVATSMGDGMPTFNGIKDLENFSPSFDNNVEEWTPMDTEGWKRRLQTGKSFTISFKGKRNVGDVGNDYIAGLAFKTGQDTSTKFQWIFADGTTVEFDCVISVTNCGGGDSTNVGALEFDVMSDGKPTIQPAA